MIISVAIRVGVLDHPPVLTTDYSTSGSSDLKCQHPKTSIYYSEGVTLDPIPTLIITLRLIILSEVTLSDFRPKRYALS